MEKINLVKLLKDCPKGMELYSPIYGLGILTKVTDRIHVKFPKEHNVKCFRLDGKVSEDGEIMIYPKGKNTWEGFHIPFKDGDIIYTKTKGNGNWLSIYKKLDGRNLRTYADISLNNNLRLYCDYEYGNVLCYKEEISEQRLATEEEKQKLYDAIKTKGYRWNPETTTFEKLIESKFKVGDKIKNKHTGICDKVIKICEDCYLVESGWDGQATIDFNIQDNWELVPNKFDITTLNPFESKVLVRDSLSSKWLPAIWGFYDEDGCNYHYQVVGGYSFVYCIPYEANKELLGTTNDCIDYYKTW